MLVAADLSISIFPSSNFSITMAFFSPIDLLGLKKMIKIRDHLKDIQRVFFSNPDQAESCSFICLNMVTVLSEHPYTLFIERVLKFKFSGAPRLGPLVSWSLVYWLGNAFV